MDEEYTIQHQDGRVKIGMQPTANCIVINRPCPDLESARARIRELEAANMKTKKEVLEESLPGLLEENKSLREERDLYLGALNRCASAAGNPDPATGCRLVIFYVKEVTE